jgi:hypothetical protein
MSLLPELPENPQLASLREQNAALSARLQDVEREKQEALVDNTEWSRFALSLVDELNRLKMKDPELNVDAVTEQLERDDDSMVDEGQSSESAMQHVRLTQLEQFWREFARIVDDPTVKVVQMMTRKIVGVEYVSHRVADMFAQKLKAHGWRGEARIEGMDDERCMVVIIESRAGAAEAASTMQ